MEIKFDPWAEKHIAKKAEQMLQSAIRSKINSLGFKEHITEGKAKLSEAEAEAKTNLGKVPEGENLKLYLNGLVLKMGKHGFTQHYGVNAIREDKKGRTRHIPRTTHYNFKNHIFKIPEKDFIGKAIQQSRVIDYVMQRITTIRNEEIMVRLKNFFEND